MAGGDTLTGGRFVNWMVGDGPEWMLPVSDRTGRVDLGPDDHLYGGDGDDHLFGDDWYGTLAGDDVIDGQRGNDLIACGGGRDVASGGSGNDSIYGQEGSDTLYGSSGFDLLVGGPGADLLIGGTGPDTPDGRDRASYESSPAAVTVDLSLGVGLGGDAQGDRLFGISDLSGSMFDDVLTGGDGNNVLDGSTGRDRLSGAGGNDTLDGGTPTGDGPLGGDTLTGGDGADVFVTGRVSPEEPESWTWITDFSVAEGDRVAVAHGPVYAVTARQDGDDVIMSYQASWNGWVGDPGGETWQILREGVLCVLQDVSLAELGSDWWVAGIP
ncbi:calcium-binding protein [Muricoccus radiodurans]|uniref:calcium-binding protein n=1 Tax=Muricoccus radiodurans TaxID=2231721 RepID=UPI003CE8255B